MRRFLLFVLISFLNIGIISAQSPDMFNYQAVARDDQGNIIENQSVGIKVSILKGSNTGTSIYEEEHTLTTTNQGIISFMIGNGSALSGSFSNIDWGSDSYFLKIGMDASGGTSYSTMGTSQLVTVPYAMYADSSGTSFNGDYADLSNKPDTTGWDMDESDDLKFPIHYEDTLEADLIYLNHYSTGSSYDDMIQLVSTDSTYEGEALNIDYQGDDNAIEISHDYGDQDAIDIYYDGESHSIDIRHDGSDNNSNVLDITNYSGGGSAIAIYHYASEDVIDITNLGGGRAIDADGDVRITGDLNVTGSKNFVEVHPNDTTKEIVYSVVEGPEAATFIRGEATLTNGSATIEFPEHFTLVTAEEDLTAQLTPAGNCNGLYVESVDNNQLVVKELNGGTSNVAFYYMVHGVRDGYQNFEVIRDREMD